MINTLSKLIMTKLNMTIFAARTSRFLHRTPTVTTAGSEINERNHLILLPIRITTSQMSFPSKGNTVVVSKPNDATQ